MNGPQNSGCLFPKWSIIAALASVVIWILLVPVGLSDYVGPFLRPFGLVVTILGVVVYVGAVVVFPSLVAGPGIAVGVLWMPFAALFCARAARSRGLDSGRYAVAGAIYSILLFIPWVYLVLRLRGRELPSSLVRMAYIILFFGIWPLATLSTFFSALFAVPLRPLLLVLPASAVTWLISIWNLWRANKRANACGDELSDAMLPHHAYIMPFAYATLWTLFAATTWAATNYIEPDWILDTTLLDALDAL